MDVHPSAIASAIALKHILTSGELPFELLHGLLEHLLEDAVPFEDASAFLADLRAGGADANFIDVVEEGLLQCQRPGGDELMTFMNDLRRLVGERAQEETCVDKRSLVGLFIRRLWLNFHRLPFHGVLTLVRDITRWNKPAFADEADMTDIFADDKMGAGMPEGLRWRAEAAADDDLAVLPARYDAFEDYEQAMRAGDHIAAHDSLRRFFDYRFGKIAAFKPSPQSRLPAPKPKERILHQQALLNLANLHFEEGGYPEAWRAVEEAARIARQVVDKECLAGCKSLIQRLHLENPLPEPELHHEPDPLPAGAIPPPPGPTPNDTRYRTALDELWSIEKGLFEGVPLHILIGGDGNTLLGNLLRAKKAGHREIVLTNTNSDSIGGRITWNKAAWHATVAELHEMGAQPLLADIHRRLALEANPSAEVKLAVTMSQADKLARSGDHKAAIQLLLDDASMMAQTSVKDVARWQRAIYEIFRTKAEQCGYQVVLDQIAQSCPPARSSAEAEEGPITAHRPSFLADEPAHLSEAAPKHAEQLLRRARKLLDAHDLVSALKPILEALSRTETSETGQGLVALHARARSLLVEWLVDSGEFAKARAELNHEPHLLHLVETMGDKHLVQSVKHSEGRLKLGLAMQLEAGETKTYDLWSAVTAFMLAAGKQPASANQPVSLLTLQIFSDLAVLTNELGDAAKRDHYAHLWQACTRGAREAEEAMLADLAHVQKRLAEVSAEAAGIGNA